uniref:Tubulin domain-containing protein n=1 Tax=Macrostomum lignano TaxID=282301 RepID=A0A1I8FCH9_9PLAT
MRSDGRVAVYEACSPDALQCTVLRPPPPRWPVRCGNQIGSRFWDLALREHASVSRRGDFDDSLGTFFRQQPGEGQALESSRTVLVDMEEGVVGELLKGRLRGVFDHSAVITDVSGSRQQLGCRALRIRPQAPEALCAEQCDCLQCFFLLHSMGGGTGSGLGTAILQLLRDQYPEVYRWFVTAVYPSEDDDVITSPYNSVLAMRCLTDYADCVMPIDNACLAGIAQRQGRQAIRRDEQHSGQPAAEPHGFRPLLRHAERDLNEISMNLVPFPRLHYLLGRAESAVPRPCRPGGRIRPFNESFGKEAQLFSARAAIASLPGLRPPAAGSNRSKRRPALRRSAGKSAGIRATGIRTAGRSGTAPCPRLGSSSRCSVWPTTLPLAPACTCSGTGSAGSISGGAHLHHYTQ